MTISRDMELYIAGTVLQLPCFFPSVSSVRTNLNPVDYVELLDLSGHPHFLVSAYDLSHCPDDQPSIDTGTKTKWRSHILVTAEV